VPRKLATLWAMLEILGQNEMERSAILTKRMPGKLNIMGIYPIYSAPLPHDKTVEKTIKKVKRESGKAEKPGKSCTAYGKVSRFPALFFGLQLQTSV